MMQSKALTYGSFIAASLAISIVFITATSYIQLGFAIILYPLVVFFALKAFSGQTKTEFSIKPKISQVNKSVESPVKTEEARIENIGIADIDKRAFLKLIGGTGVLFFIASIFGKRVENLLFGQNLLKTPSSTINPPIDSLPQTTKTSPTDNYKIAEIDDSLISYYGFIDKDGGWFIMKIDNDSGSFRYLKGKSNFPDYWNKRTQLEYDYFHNVFP